MGLMAPTPAVPVPSLTCAGGQEGGGEGPHQLFHCSQARAVPPKRATVAEGRARQMAHGDRQRTGGLTATLGAWPSRDPSPGSERRRDALGTGASTCYTSHTGHSGCHKRHCFRKQLSAHCLSEPSPAGCHLPSQTTPRKCRARHSHCVSPGKLVAQRTRAGLLATLQGPAGQGKAVPGQALSPRPSTHPTRKSPRPAT